MPAHDPEPRPAARSEPVPPLRKSSRSRQRVVVSLSSLAKAPPLAEEQPRTPPPAPATSSMAAESKPNSSSASNLFMEEEPSFEAAPFGWKELEPGELPTADISAEVFQIESPSNKLPENSGLLASAKLPPLPAERNAALLKPPAVPIPRTIATGLRKNVPKVPAIKAPDLSPNPAGAPVGAASPAIPLPPLPQKRPDPLITARAPVTPSIPTAAQKEVKESAPAGSDSGKAPRRTLGSMFTQILRPYAPREPRTRARLLTPLPPQRETVSPPAKAVPAPERAPTEVKMEAKPPIVAPGEAIRVVPPLEIAKPEPSKSLRDEASPTPALQKPLADVVKAPELVEIGLRKTSVPPQPGSPAQVEVVLVPAQAEASVLPPPSPPESSVNLTPAVSLKAPPVPLAPLFPSAALPLAAGTARIPPPLLPAIGFPTSLVPLAPVSSPLTQPSFPLTPPIPLAPIRLIGREPFVPPLIPAPVADVLPSSPVTEQSTPPVSPSIPVEANSSKAHPTPIEEPPAPPLPIPDKPTAIAPAAFSPPIHEISAKPISRSEPVIEPEVVSIPMPIAPMPQSVVAARPTPIIDMPAFREIARVTPVPIAPVPIVEARPAPVAEAPALRENSSVTPVPIAPVPLSPVPIGETRPVPVSEAPALRETSSVTPAPIVPLPAFRQLEAPAQKRPTSLLPPPLPPPVAPEQAPVEVVPITARATPAPATTQPPVPPLPKPVEITLPPVRARESSARSGLPPLVSSSPPLFVETRATPPPLPPPLPAAPAKPRLIQARPFGTETKSGLPAPVRIAVSIPIVPPLTEVPASDLHVPPRKKKRQVLAARLAAVLRAPKRLTAKKPVARLLPLPGQPSTTRVSNAPGAASTPDQFATARADRQRKRRLVSLVFFYILLVAVVAVLGFGGLYYGQETRVEGQIIPPEGMTLSKDAMIVTDLRVDIAGVVDDFAKERLSKMPNIAFDTQHVQRAQADIAQREERIRLLREQVQSSKDEITTTIKQARDQAQAIWDGPGTELDNSYNNRLDELQKTIANRAASLKLKYTPDNTYRSPDVWANAYRLALYEVPPGVDGTKEHDWIEAQMVGWRKFQKELDAKKQALREQATQIQMSPTNKLADINTQIDGLQHQIASTEAEETPIQSELQQAQADLATAQNDLTALNPVYLKQLSALPEAHASEHLAVRANGRFSFLDFKNAFIGDETSRKFWLFARAYRSDGTEYWTFDEFTVRKNVSTLLFIEPGSFVSTKVLLRPDLPAGEAGPL